MVLLACILLLALGLRLYRLDEQSINYDEFNALLHDPGASFTAQMAHINTVNPDHQLTFFALLYFWIKLTGAGPLALRLTAIVIGCLSIVVVHAIGRNLFGRFAANTGALLMAMSPMFIYHHQAIRYHSLMDLLIALSIWLTLVLARHSHWGMLLLHAALNSLIVEIHFSAAPLLAVQGIFLALCWRVPPAAQASSRLAPLMGLVTRKAVLWALLHIPVGVHVLYWFREIGQNTSVTWYTWPKMEQWLNDLLGDLVVFIAREFRMTPLRFVLGDTNSRDWPQYIADVLLLLFIGAAMLWGLWAVLRRARDNSAAPDTRLGPIFLYLVAIFPITAFTIVSALWQPVLLPRYTLYSSIGVFLITGLALQSLRPRPLRAIATASLTLLVAAQLATYLPFRSRPNWIGAGRELAARATPGEILLGLTRMPDGVRPIPGPLAMLRGNTPGLDLRFVPAYTLQGALDVATACMLEDQAKTASIWMLIEDWTAFRKRIKLEQLLRKRGIEYRYWKSTNIHLYELVRLDPPLDSPAATADPPKSPIALDDAELLKLVDETAMPHGAREEVLRSLRWATEHVPISRNDHISLLAGLAAMEVYPPVGRVLEYNRLRTDAQLRWDEIWAGLSYLAEGDFETGRSILVSASPDALRFIKGRVPGFDDLLNGDIEYARDVMVAVDRLSPSMIPPFFRYLLRIEPPPCGSTLKPLL